MMSLFQTGIKSCGATDINKPIILTPLSPIMASTLAPPARFERITRFIDVTDINKPIILTPLSPIMASTLVPPARCEVDQALGSAPSIGKCTKHWEVDQALGS